MLFEKCLSKQKKVRSFVIIVTATVFFINVCDLMAGGQPYTTLVMRRPRDTLEPFALKALDFELPEI